MQFGWDCIKRGVLWGAFGHHAMDPYFLGKQELGGLERFQLEIIGLCLDWFACWCYGICLPEEATLENLGHMVAKFPRGYRVSIPTIFHVAYVGLGMMKLSSRVTLLAWNLVIFSTSVYLCSVAKSFHRQQGYLTNHLDHSKVRFRKSLDRSRKAQWIHDI